MVMLFYGLIVSFFFYLEHNALYTEISEIHLFLCFCVSNSFLFVTTLIFVSMI